MSLSDWLWTEDLLSGRALPLLHDLDDHDGWAVASAATTLLGALAPLGLHLLAQGSPPPQRARPRWAELGDTVLTLGSAALKITLNASLLFHNAAALDPDVGAGLCAIPVFALLCMHGTDAPGYGYPTRVLAFGLTILALALATAAADFSEPSPPDAKPDPLSLLVLTMDAAYACTDRRAQPSLFLASRGLFFAGLALSRPLMDPLLRHADLGALFFFHSAMLLHSSLLHAGTARIAIARLSGAPGRTTRSLMLLLAATLALAYKFQWQHPRWASYMVAALMLAGGCLWAAERWQARVAPR